MNGRKYAGLEVHHRRILANKLQIFKPQKRLLVSGS